MVVVGEKFGGRESKRENENDMTHTLFFVYCFFFFFFFNKRLVSPSWVNQGKCGITAHKMLLRRMTLWVESRV
jgi:hypothetical protein